MRQRLISSVAALACAGALVAASRPLAWSPGPAAGATGRAAQGDAAGAATAARDEAAVRAVVDRYVDARERRDQAAVGALFADDADQFNTAGEWRRGRAAIVRGTAESSQRNSGTRRIVLRAVRFPSADVAIADGDYEIAGAQDGAARRTWTTVVLVRQAAGWRIAAIRNALPTGPVTIRD